MVTRDAAKIAGLDDKLGALAKGPPADLVVLERRLEDPWENVLRPEPAWVELVMIGGDLAYGRADWMTGPARGRRLSGSSRSSPGASRCSSTRATPRSEPTRRRRDSRKFGSGC